MLYDKTIALKMKDKITYNKGIAKKMLDYYFGKTDVIQDYTENSGRSNIKINDNFIKSFIDEEVSFMTGMPITYSSKSSNKDAIKNIEFNFNNISASLDTELAKNLLIFGETYELYYVDDTEFKIKCFTPLNSYAYRDIENKVELFIYVYRVDLDDTQTEYIEVIDDEYIHHFDSNFTKIKDPTQHSFGFVPVGVASLINGADDTLYNNIKRLQDAYEIALSDWGNEISDTRLAYLLLTGVELDDESATKMKSMGIMQLPNADGKASYLTKNLSSDFLKEYRGIIKEDIYRVAQHIDNQTQVQSNTSGTMLATRLNCLRIKITTQNQALKNCIKTRIKCLFIYLSKMQSLDFDYRDIDIKPQLNLPANDVETAQIATQMTGKMSIRTILERFSFITNGQEEFNRMLEEQKIITKNSAPEINLNDLGDTNG